MATLKPTTPLQPLMQTNMKPPSPLLTPRQRPLKPTTPLQPKNTPKTPISHPQRRWRFQLRLSLREQRRHRFHARDFQCTRAMAEPGRAPSQRAEPHTATRRRRCGGRRRVRRARAGFEIDHSEPQARVWRSRGRAAAHRHTQRPGPTSSARTLRGIAKGAGISRPLARVPSLIHEGYLDAAH